MNHTIESLKEQVKELRREKRNLKKRIKHYTNWEENKKKKRDEARKYRQTDKGKEACRKYDKSDKGKETQKKYRESEKGKKTTEKKLKIYYQTDNYDKVKRISKWKYRGLIDNYDKVYERYEYTLFCDECRCDLDQCTKSLKCMDHDHTTGLFRNILCNTCNVKRG